MQTALEAMRALDSVNDGTGDTGKPPLDMKLVGVDAGDVLQLPIPTKKANGAQLSIQVFAVNHAGCPAVGYTIISQQAPQLKPEYRDTPGEQLRELAKSGVSLRESQRILEVSYTGDTCLGGLLENPNPNLIEEALSCGWFLCEATMLDGKSVDKAKERGHMHLVDIVALLKSRTWDNANQKLLFVHISDRYNAPTALQYFAEAIPEEYAGLVHVSISSLSGHYTFHRLARNGIVRMSDYVKSNKNKPEDASGNNNSQGGKSKKKGGDHGRIEDQKPHQKAADGRGETSGGRGHDDGKTNRRDRSTRGGRGGRRGKPHQKKDQGKTNGGEEEEENEHQHNDVQASQQQNETTKATRAPPPTTETD